MRAQLSLFAIVVTLVAVLAVMPKGRAAGDVADEAGEISSATAAKPDSDVAATETTDTTQASSGDPRLSTTDAEEIVGGVYHDDARIWGNQLTWNQLNPARLKAHSVYSCGFGEPSDSDVAACPLGASTENRIAAKKAYQDSARKLDEIANDLEEAKLFHDADQVREITSKLRTRARSLPADPEPEIYGGFTVGLAR